MENVQTTTETQKSQKIQNALIQWDTPVSTKDGDELFNFPEVFKSINPSVIVNRTNSEGRDVLSITSADSRGYVIDRRSAIDHNDPFNMLAIGSTSNGGPSYSKVNPDGKTVAMIQWGNGLTTTDGDERITFPVAFSKDCYAVLTNRREENGRAILPVVRIDATSFTVNRHNSIAGDEEFFWIAIGDCDPIQGNFSFPIGGGYTMKGGMGLSTSSDQQTFSFETMGLENFDKECYTVVTTRTSSGGQDILPVVRKNKTEFSINRHKDLKGGQEFYWVAIGK